MTIRAHDGLLKSGIELGLPTLDAEFSKEIQRSTAASTVNGATIIAEVPGPTRSYFDSLLPDGKRRHYRVRAVGPTTCWKESDWTRWVSALPKLERSETPRRPKPGDDIIRDPDGSNATAKDILHKLTDGGDADIDFQVGGFAINRHTESDTVQSGTTVTFGQDYDNVPSVNFVPQSGISQTTEFTRTAKQDMRASGLSVSGFNATAQIKSSTGLTSSAETDGFSSTQNTGAPENGTVSLNVEGDVAFSNLEDANTNETEYKAFFNVSTTNLGGGGTVQVALDANDGTTSVSWTEKDSDFYQDGVNLSGESLSFTGTLGSSFDLRLRIKSLNPGFQPPSTTVTITALGEDSTQPGVEFDKVTSSPTAISMTPDASDRVYYEAKDGG